MQRISIFILLTSIIVTGFAYAAETVVNVRDVDFDFSLKDGHYPKENEIFYGKQMTSWEKWQASKSYSALKPSKELLFPKPPKKRPDLKVFEARFAGVINKPVSYFNESYLHNFNTILRLDTNPEDSHVNVSTPDQFKIITKIQFPPRWAEAVSLGRKTNLLDPSKTDYIEMVSEFTYFDYDLIKNNPDVKAIADELDVAGQTPRAIDLQNMTSINQIAYFGSIVTLYYYIDDQHTLVVSTFVLGLKEKDLKLGFHFYPYDFNGEAVLFGQNPMMRTENCKGLCEGLPEYTKQIFLSTFNGLRH